jgi:tetraacyldisaccharide 4'-kinase
MSEFRKLLYPLAILYGLILRFRHFLYDVNIFKVTTYGFPVICVGNLSVGGTGKSPMTEYLIRLLSTTYKVGILSRGYGRKTSGYLLADASSDALQIGDEPYQYFKKFKNSKVAVAEKRTYGIEQLRKDTDAEVIILDDAFQHRQVRAGLNLLLTTFDNIFTDDYLLPAGYLRDIRSRASAAEIIIITKCPESLSKEKKEQLLRKLKRYGSPAVFFTGIKYNTLLRNNKVQVSLEELRSTTFTLVTGIAKPQPLVDFLKAKGFVFEHIRYSDHHIFTAKELEVLKTKPQILTTEKDFMRLESHLPECLFIAIETYFLDEGETEFNKKVLDYISKEKRIR